MDEKRTMLPMESPTPLPETNEYMDTYHNEYLPEAVSWEASEYIHSDKTALWFVGLISIGVVLFCIAAFVFNEFIFAVLILVMTAAMFVVAKQTPRTLNYSINPSSLRIGDKTFSLHEFRSFSMIKEGGIYSIMLIPVKRFAPPITLYFPPENGEDIVDIIGSVVPMEERKLDFVDKITQRLRF